METALDPGILADFLAEAGDLVADLDEQLLALESASHDHETINAVFRAFHTIKGGAGFLALSPMIELCHGAEDLLNEIRSERIELNDSHMEALFSAHDQVRAMLDALNQGDTPQPAPQELLEQLRRLLAVADASSIAASATTPAPAVPLTDTDPVEAEFEQILAAAENGTDTTHPAGAIDDSEFEALLDHIYGAGHAPGVATPSATPVTPVEDVTGSPVAGADSIGDAEFEQLLDNLHGTGRSPGQDAAKPVPIADVAPVTAQPAVVSKSDQAAHERGQDKSKPKSGHAVVSESSVRVNTTRLDAMMDRVGELVLARNRMNVLTAGCENVPLERAVAELDRVTDELQMEIMQTRMQPVARLFQRFPRIVRDLARQLGKQIELVQQGEDTQIDRSLVEALADPMVHLVRNALDHGLEPPQERAAAGKPVTGRLELSAAQEGERIVITIRDDGRGMNAEVLRRKALEKGLLGAERAASLSERECHELIFMPGFSTCKEISDISGRGVGMDVVKTRIAKLGGSVQLQSKQGSGSEFRLLLPLTLLIVRTLRVAVGDCQLALPLAQVVEIFETTATAVQRLEGAEVIAHRGRPLPLLRLHEWLEHGTKQQGRWHVVVIEAAHRRAGLLVHEVQGREDVVIKPLGSMFQQVQGLSGAAVTGDGRVALVLDLGHMLAGTMHDLEARTCSC